MTEKSVTIETENPAKTFPARFRTGTTAMVMVNARIFERPRADLADIPLISAYPCELFLGKPIDLESIFLASLPQYFSIGAIVDFPFGCNGFLVFNCPSSLHRKATVTSKMFCSVERSLRLSESRLPMLAVVFLVIFA